MGPSSDPICALFNLDRPLENDDRHSDVEDSSYATDKRGDSSLDEIDRRKRYEHCLFVCLSVRLPV